jgi:glycosyltransferase involved in cell wall biosynthesis
MIVKDEETVLERCLKSVQGYVDEIIIVDTGSTDSTPEIARRFTDHVYTFEWNHDFSAARNESLKHASGKWILVLDADEYFEDPEIRKLRQLLESLEPQPHLIYNVTIVNLVGKKYNLSIHEGKVGRVFGNRLDIRYVRPIHEQPRSSRPGIEMRSVDLPVRVFHSGYVEETLAAKNKHQRNLELFKRLENSSNLSAYDHFQLGNQFTMMGEFDKGLEHLEKALQNKKNLGVVYHHAVIATMQAWTCKGEFAKAYHVFEQHMETSDLFPDLLAIKGILLQNLGFIAKAKETFLAAIDKAERLAAQNKPIAFASTELAVRSPLFLLAFIHEREHDYAQSLYYLTKVILANPKEVPAVTKFMELMALREPPEAIIELIGRLLNPDTLLTALLGKIAIRLGNVPIATYYAGSPEIRKMLKPDERLRYHILTDDPEAFLNEWAVATADERHDPQNAMQYVWGALRWNRPEWLERIPLPEDHDCSPLIKWLLSWFDGTADRSLDHGLAAEMLQEMYTLGQFDVFDRLMECLDDNAVVNKLANFFYERHRTDLALQYYRHLLECDGLNADSCENLAEWCVLQDDIPSALQFWEQAIRLAPERKRLYVKYLLHCPDPTARNTVKHQLFEKDPTYKELSLLRML